MAIPPGNHDNPRAHRHRLTTNAIQEKAAMLAITIEL
jgi:hypothetical protein